MIILTCWNGPVNGLGVPPIDVLSPVTAGNLPFINTVVFTVGRMVLIPGCQGTGIKGLTLTAVTFDNTLPLQ